MFITISAEITMAIARELEQLTDFRIESWAAISAMGVALAQGPAGAEKNHYCKYGLTILLVI